MWTNGAGRIGYQILSPSLYAIDGIEMMLSGAILLLAYTPQGSRLFVQKADDWNPNWFRFALPSCRFVYLPISHFRTHSVFHSYSCLEEASWEIPSVLSVASAMALGKDPLKQVSPWSSHRLAFLLQASSYRSRHPPKPTYMRCNLGSVLIKAEQDWSISIP